MSLGLSQLKGEVAPSLRPKRRSSSDTGPMRDHADRARDRIRHLVYLDAFVPADGQSLNDLRGPAPETALVDGWLVPPMPSAPDTAPEDLDWTRPRRRHQPNPPRRQVNLPRRRPAQAPSRLPPSCARRRQMRRGHWERWPHLQRHCSGERRHHCAAASAPPPES